MSASGLLDAVGLGNTTQRVSSFLRVLCGCSGYMAFAHTYLQKLPGIFFFIETVLNE